MVTSIKEGWCIVVTEANSQGTPAVAYDVDGLRDSVMDGETGLISNANPEDFAKKIVDLLSNQSKYSRVQRGAWETSKDVNFDKGALELEKILTEHYEKIK